MATCKNRECFADDVQGKKTCTGAEGMSSRGWSGNSNLCLAWSGF